MGYLLCLTLILLITPFCYQVNVTKRECKDCLNVHRLPALITDCAINYSSCGSCLPGHVASSSKVDECTQLEMWENNWTLNYYAALGSKVRLRCLTNIPIKCMWRLNGRVPNILQDSSYEYEHSEAKMNRATKNCNFHILSVSENDYGEWSCMNQVQDPISSVVKVKSMWLKSLTPVPVLLEQAAPLVRAFNGDRLNLKCIFNQPVSCQWMFRHINATHFHNVNVSYYNGGRRFYENGDGISQYNCGLIIDNVQDGDLGYWMCSSGDGPLAVKSSPSLLWVEAKISKPLNISEIGLIENVELKCESGSGSDCQVASSGREVSVDYFQIRYFNQSASSNCSFSFHFSDNGYGEWACFSSSNSTDSFQVQLSLGPNGWFKDWRVVIVSDIAISVFTVLLVFASAIRYHILLKKITNEGKVPDKKSKDSSDPKKASRIMEHNPEYVLIN